MQDPDATHCSAHRVAARSLERGSRGTPPDGEFGWGGAPAKAQRRRPKAGSGRTETRRGAKEQKPA